MADYADSENAHRSAPTRDGPRRRSDRSHHGHGLMTDLRSKIRSDGPTMALAALGVVVVVAVGFGVFVASIRVLLPAVYDVTPDADPSLVAAVVGFGPAAVYGVGVAVLVRRLIVGGE